MIESSKRWWKCKNYFNQVGFVPFNILQPTTHVESPVSSRPPSVRPAHTTCCAQAWTLLSVNSRFLSDPQPPLPIPPSCRLPSRRPSRRLSPPSHPALRFYTPQTPRSVRAACHLTASTYQLQTTRKTKVPTCWACVCLGVTVRESKATQVSKVCPDSQAFSLQKKKKNAVCMRQTFPIYASIVMCILSTFQLFDGLFESCVFSVTHLLFTLCSHAGKWWAAPQVDQWKGQSEQTPVHPALIRDRHSSGLWLFSRGSSRLAQRKRLQWTVSIVVFFIYFFFLSVRVNEEK